MDVDTAFLNAKLSEEVFIDQPEGFIDKEHPKGKDYLPQGFINSDWGGDSNTYNSMTGIISTYLGGLIHWASKAQKYITLSTAEAEFNMLSWNPLWRSRSTYHCSVQTRRASPEKQTLWRENSPSLQPPSQA